MERPTKRRPNMKRLLLLILSGLMLASCNDEEKIIGSERTFVVKSTTTDWPRNTYKAITRTYEVTASGAGNGWTASLLDGQQGFVLETNPAANTFTVSIGENTGKVNLEDYVCVTYSGEMIYIPLLQISNYFSVSPGADLGGGIYKYTVADDGTSTYTGTIANPGTGTVSVTYVSGSEVFTPVLEPAEKPTSLRFTAPANVTFFPNEAIYAVAVSDKPDQTVQITVYQPGLEVPMGALPDAGAPGGYYYPLVCGIDVAGVNIPVKETDTWNDIFDPDLMVEQTGTSVNQTAPVNPCPEGWNAPTEAQMRRIIEAENWTWNKDADATGPDYFYWNMRDGGRSDCEIFGATRTNPEIRPWSCETRGNAQPQAWRLQINRSSSAKLSISSAGRTTVMGSGNYSYIVRCVREGE